jgi:hypothetical protein
VCELDFTKRRQSNAGALFQRDDLAVRSMGRNFHGEAGCHGAVGHRDVLGFAGVCAVRFQMICRESVFAGGNATDLEIAVFVGDGEKGIILNADISEHPWMDVAFEFHHDLRGLDAGDPFSVIDVAGAGLGEIEFGVSVGFGEGVDVVHDGVGIFDCQRLADSDAADVRFVVAALLVDFGSLGVGGEFFAFQAFGDIDENVGQAVVRSDDVVAGSGNGGMEFAAGVVEGDCFLGRRSAFKGDLAGDVACGGELDGASESDESQRESKFLHR